MSLRCSLGIHKWGRWRHQVRRVYSWVLDMYYDRDTRTRSCVRCGEKVTEIL